ncbi:glycoprotein-N-acetylgalactosamine 3-beta-galactosyltransferase 1 [Frankliniella occidentalis]|uniref:Glycoprotein-N-acetylgalactosamine 3-beta-galactosyltransferase 1 n=1 Tax=Frankliniella occidentalis TaxID=133901 RepID=A0A9C6XUB6_FRAOC|nr:glycoprotein-N-acetylgalactosamine 3-beta-galactosyltransferase 1 [Frankliniella occidentalis]
MTTSGYTGLLRPPAGRTFCYLICGIFIGFSSAFMLLSISSNISSFGDLLIPPRPGPRHSDSHGHGQDSSEMLPHPQEFGAHSSDEDFHKGEDVVAQKLAEKVRVLCWIMTSPSNHEKKARHIKATWGKRCNILLFMSTANDTSLPTQSILSLLINCEFEFVLFVASWKRRGLGARVIIDIYYFDLTDTL